LVVLGTALLAFEDSAPRASQGGANAALLQKRPQHALSFVLLAAVIALHTSKDLAVAVDLIRADPGSS
jgi:hypothetical protein